MIVVLSLLSAILFIACCGDSSSDNNQANVNNQQQPQQPQQPQHPQQPQQQQQPQQPQPQPQQQQQPSLSIESDIELPLTSSTMSAPIHATQSMGVNANDGTH